MKLLKKLNGISGHTKSTDLIINIIKIIKISGETVPLNCKTSGRGKISFSAVGGEKYSFLRGEHVSLETYIPKMLSRKDAVWNPG